MSFMRFLVLSLGDRVPKKDIWLYHKSPYKKLA